MTTKQRTALGHTETTTEPATSGELPPRSARRPTAAEALDELTGHDEREIEERFGRIIEALLGAKYMRALAFSQELHDGVKPAEAFKKIMDLTQAQVAPYFTEPTDEENQGADPNADQADDS